jgi:hypothetical protein
MYSHRDHILSVSSTYCSNVNSRSNNHNNNEIQLEWIWSGTEARGRQDLTPLRALMLVGRTNACQHRAPPHKIYDMTNGTMTTVAQPNATLYVSNIDWKVKKSLLRRALHALFSNHGKVRKLTECCALELGTPSDTVFFFDLIVFTLACFCRF